MIAVPPMIMNLNGY